MAPTKNKQTPKAQAPNAETPQKLTVFIDDSVTPWFDGYVPEAQAQQFVELIGKLTEMAAPEGTEPETKARRLPPTQNSIVHEEDAYIWIDRILDNTDTDNPKPLSELLAFLADYQTGEMRDAFDWLLYAAYRRSEAYHEGHQKFLASVSVERKTP